MTLSGCSAILHIGGHLQDDTTVELPFPRDAARDEVALAKADVLRKFESLDLVAT